MIRQQLENEYREILQAYLKGKDEDQLYLAQQFSKVLVRKKIAPEDVIDIHRSSLEQMVELPELVRESFYLLTEVMIEYGNTYRENQMLRDKQQQMETEIDVAVSMQQSLLPEQIPSYPDLDIGIISVPAKQMSGDYYNIVSQTPKSFGIAIADIIGKGIPAALCMSMIKYAMDSLYTRYVEPATVLKRLNTIVEKNVEAGMFVTMLYGMYQIEKHCFRYACAGHEPGVVYRATEQKFADLDGQGLVLGVAQEVYYSSYEIDLQAGDYLILMTDGVTERKIGKQYLSRDALLQMMREEIGVSAQKMVDNLYKRLLAISDFKLPDDHTMMVIHRKF
ncbi:PP2C family protein-serine/threonine phosphatase [Brevibacillus fulvus]|uniref:Sigma-B regulation protein RsbU (Phosphoserine phosphatase) n=1 Tax=Brevibacillus fulvus TaxID=1125967 RepID=A0A939BQG2_9BACL|nr:PP2C family protein-serine/threonine phosphatase [Brevibacillus fulvus]MBM7591585.1 sigma-B regulation protein RsbU (phosphoserine phosphatase) [Brevibacillus fulvus]